MSKTFALFKRMSPYLAEKARNLIDAMLLSTGDIGWDSQQQLIVNGRVYHDTDIVRLIAASPEAFEDFAVIQTQQDVDLFNQKYNVELVLPAEA